MTWTLFASHLIALACGAAAALIGVRWSLTSDPWPEDRSMADEDPHPELTSKD